MGLPLVLVWSRGALHVLLKPDYQVARRDSAFDQDHVGGDYLAAVGIRFADDCCLEDGLVFDQHRLHLEGADPVGGGQDQVVIAADEMSATRAPLHRALCLQKTRSRGVWQTRVFVRQAPADAVATMSQEMFP